MAKYKCSCGCEVFSLPTISTKYRVFGKPIVTQSPGRCFECGKERPLKNPLEGFK